MPQTDPFRMALEKKHQQTEDVFKDTSQNPTEVKEDLVNNPQHYGGRKCLDGLKGLLEAQEYIGGLKFNIYKYIFRYKAKNRRQDLKKARFYLDELEHFEYGADSTSQ